MPQVAKVGIIMRSDHSSGLHLSAHVATLQFVQTSQRGYLHFNVCSSYSMDYSLTIMFICTPGHMIAGRQYSI